MRIPSPRSIDHGSLRAVREIVVIVAAVRMTKPMHFVILGWPVRHTASPKHRFPMVGQRSKQGDYVTHKNHGKIKKFDSAAVKTNAAQTCFPLPGQ